MLLTITSVGANAPKVQAEETEETVTITFIDNTEEKWVGNDNAVIELVDNTQGHDKYDMEKVDDHTWSVTVPARAYNITFNRYDADKKNLWNSWSAGGRDGKVTYEALSTAHGAWKEEKEEFGFQAGDSIYLDISEFPSWESDNAIFYANLTSATRKENGNQDIKIKEANKKYYEPLDSVIKVEDGIYSYTFTEETEGKDVIRFWRGNKDTLWNCSVELSYKDYYEKGINCIKVTDWSEKGLLKNIIPRDRLKIDTSKFIYNSELDIYEINEAIKEISGELINSKTIQSFECVIKDYNGNKVFQDTIDISEKWKIEKIGFVMGFNKVSFIAKDNKNHTIEKEITIFNTSEENTTNVDIDEKDDDGDKINNYYENFFGTNPNSVDTDQDGLDDAKELFQYGTDPLKKDSDSNGINDGEEDFDKDGLSIMEELKLETDPFNKDSDEDGLDDGEEIQKYNTDPNKDDTDGDTICDGDEIALGFNPLECDTDKNGILDCDEKKEQKLVLDTQQSENKGVNNVSVELACTGLIDREVTVRDVYKKDTRCTNIVGLVGVPVEFETEQEFDNATITFSYDVGELKGSSEDNLAIAWYDEKNDEFVIYDKQSIIDKKNHTISIQTTHFSKYCLIDAKKYLEAMQKPINYRGNNTSEPVNYDIAFVVDKSGSMNGERIRRAKETVYQCLDAMYENDKACLISFNSGGKINSKLGTDFEQIKKTAKSIKSEGGTNTNVGLYYGIEELVESDDKNEKIIFMICDGDVNYVQSTIDKAIDKKIKINTINVIDGSSYELEKIAQETGGQYFYARTTSDMQTIADTIRRKIINYVDTQDSDKDGIYDVYEINGVKLSNGEIIYSDPMKVDSDEDGLSDFEELGSPQEIHIDSKWGAYDISIFKAKSNPKKGDSDEDGVKDSEDENPEDNARHFKEYGPTKLPFDTNILSIGSVKEYKIKGDNKSKKSYKKGKYSPIEKLNIMDSWKSAMALADAGKFVTPTASKALFHYLQNTGTTRKFSSKEMKSFFDTTEGNRYYKIEVENIKEYAEDVLKDGHSMMVVSKKRFKTFETDLQPNLKFCKDLNWVTTLGGAEGVMIAKIRRKGNTYTIYYRYIIVDYYNWEEGDEKEFIRGFSNGTMWKMQHLGVARDYFHYGEYIDGITYTRKVKKR